MLRLVSGIGRTTRSINKINDLILKSLQPCVLKGWGNGRSYSAASATWTLRRVSSTGV